MAGTNTAAPAARFRAVLISYQDRPAIERGGRGGKEERREFDREDGDG